MFNMITHKSENRRGQRMKKEEEQYGVTEKKALKEIEKEEKNLKKHIIYYENKAIERCGDEINKKVEQLKEDVLIISEKDWKRKCDLAGALLQKIKERLEK